LRLGLWNEQKQNIKIGKLDTKRVEGTKRQKSINRTIKVI